MLTGGIGFGLGRGFESRFQRRIKYIVRDGGREGIVFFIQVDVSFKLDVFC